MSNNLIVALFLLALIAGGVWLANSIADSKRAQECIESGRRNCRIIDAK